MPRAPGRLALAIDRLWNGAPCTDPRLHGRMELWATDAGLALEAFLPDADPERIPAAPARSRVANLWEYDVMECFLVDASGAYLEVEVGPGGHFLVLGFDAPRRLRDGHEGLRPRLAHERHAGGWSARIELDRALLPQDLCALNAFVIARGRHLAHAALPGETPDFHQPAHFPSARWGP